MFFYFSFQISLTVLDKNDSPPVFRDTPLIYSVSEDLGAGHTIATIRATDPDTLGTLNYTMMNGDDGKFELESKTGKLRLQDSLDRETKDVYHLVIRVTDGMQFTETIVTVQVRIITIFVCFFFFFYEDESFKLAEGPSINFLSFKFLVGLLLNRS